MDSDRKHLTSVLRQAVSHRGAALVEIYQNCPIFHDGAFEVLKDRTEAQARLIKLEHGEPIRFGPEWAAEDGGDGAGRLGVVRDGAGRLVVREVAEAGADAVLVHDAHADDPSLPFAISRLDDPTMTHVPMGVFRSVQRGVYDDLVRDQVQHAVETAGGPAGDDALAALLAGNDTWQVS